MPGNRTVRTYIVEDNPTIRENLVATLEELGGVASIGFAETEEQGSGWLTSPDGQWDLAIVDLFLKQGMQGPQGPSEGGGADELRHARYSNPLHAIGRGRGFRQVNRYRCLDRLLPGAAERLTLTRNARQSRQLSGQYSAHDCP